MTEQDAIAFADRLKSDVAFRSRLADAPNEAAREAIIREAGYNIGPGDLPAIKAALGLEELSDEDLERMDRDLASTNRSESGTFQTAQFVSALVYLPTLPGGG